jgi:DNA-binding protein Fis
VALIEDPQNRVWRTGSGVNGNEIYALIHNDVTKPTRDDLLIGSMENETIAEHIVDMHNRVLRKFGRHYIRALKAE